MEPGFSSDNGFGPKHLGLITACMIFLLIFTVVKGNFDWQNLVKIFHTKADTNTSQSMTYEQLDAKVRADFANSGNEIVPVTELTADGLSQIDPSVAMGEVLGAATGDQVDLNSIYDQSELNKIPVKVLAGSNNISEIKNYFAQVQLIEASNYSLLIIAGISSADPQALSDSKSRAQEIINELNQIATPSDLVDYQRTKLLYYSSLLSLAGSIGDTTGQQDSSTASMLFFSIQQKLSNMEQNFQNKYGISL